MRPQSIRGMTPAVLLLFTVACGSGIPETSGGADGRSLIAGPTSAFTNGQWFTGSTFRRQTMYAVNGVFVRRVPARIDTTIDLRGGFVIPPLGDAHTHNLDGPFRLDEMRDAYVREGTFYVQVLTNTRSGAEQVWSRFHGPCSIDVAYANGGLTSTLSHPFLAYEPRALGIFSDSAARVRAQEISSSRRRERNAYWFIDSLPALERQWPDILDGRPDLIKIFLLDASEDAPIRERIVEDEHGFDSGHGLKPSLVAPIVARAHREGLRVAAHVETADDAAIAIEAGVDILAHVPGYQAMADQADEDVLVPDAVARQASARGVVVVPTASWAAIASGPDSTRVVARRRRLLRQNLQRLIEHGVTVAVGSDYYGQTLTREIRTLRDLDLWDNRALLDMLVEDTPRSIFPTRRIGRLDFGYEASFLVLDENPLEHLDALAGIQLRVKRGCVLRP